MSVDDDEGEGVPQESNAQINDTEDTPAAGDVVPPPVEIGKEDWQFKRELFLALNKKFGPFTLDGACDVAGSNAHVAENFCSKDDPFQRRDLSGQNIWLNPPFSQAADFLEHYLRSKAKDPTIRGVFILPKWPSRPWWKLVKNFKLYKEYPAGSQLFTCPAPYAVTGRTALDPIKWPVQIYVDDSPDIKFLPKHLKPPEKIKWSAVKILLSTKKKLLMQRHRSTNTAELMTFINGAATAEDDSPEMTARRILQEQLKHSTLALRLLGVEKERGSTIYTYHVDSLPQHYDANEFRMLTWEQLLTARRHGNLPDGTTVTLPTFGRHIDKYINLETGDSVASIQLCSVQAGQRVINTTGMINNTPCRILIDSGATRDFVSHSWANRAGLRLSSGERVRIKLADGSRTWAARQLRTTLTIGDHRYDLSAVATRLDQWDLILGMPWLRHTNPDVDWPTGAVLDRSTNLPLFKTQLETVPVVLQHVTAQQTAKDLRNRDNVCFLSTLKELNDVPQTLQQIKTDQGPEFTDRLRATLSKYDDIISEPTTLPPSRPWDFDIELETDEPPRQRTYRMSPAELREVQKQLSDMMEKGWIRPSTSPYGAPILFVRKKDGTLRMCVDYRKLNDITKKNRTPLPRIDELLDSLHGATIFSSLDLYKGYHQCRVKEESVHKTAFRTSFGLFEFTVLPFGLTNAPAVFQTMMNNVLKDYIGKFCVVYLDDVLIYSKTPEEHLRHIDLIMAALQKHKLHINPSKCFFGRKAVDFLGVVVENNTLRMDDKKIAAIKAWPRPTNVKEMRGFLGLAGYYRRFIDRFSARTVPLTELTKTTQPFRWTAAAQTAFEDVKRAMTEAPCLLIADTSSDAKFTLYTDASGFAVGAVLLQDQGRGLQPVAFHARKMNKHERHYPVHEQELLAVKDAVQAFRCYLHGCAGFTVITDHNSLRWFFSQPDLSPRQVRWYQVLAPYQRMMDIVYKKGALNMADGLSRRPDLMEAITKLKLTTDLPNQEVAEEEAMLHAIEFAVTVGSKLFADIKAAYCKDPMYSPDSKALPRGVVLHDDGFYRAHDSRIAVPDDLDLRRRLPTGGAT